MKKRTKELAGYIFLSILMVFALIHAIKGIWWVSWGCLMVIGIYILAFSNHRFALAFRKRAIFTYTFLFAWLFLFIIALRVLVFGVYYIPSSSMERTILPGDIIWGNKLAYGPVLPQTPYEIPWINLFTWLAEGSNADLEKKWWDYKRLRGIRKVSHGDIVLFQQNKNVMIKRCLGTPGDTLKIVAGKVYINNKLYDEPDNILFFSRVVVNDQKQAILAFDSLGINTTSFLTPNYDRNIFTAYLTQKEKAKISLLPFVTNLSIEMERADTAWKVYPRHPLFDWSIDDYGPMVIPKKGMKLELNEENWVLYGKLIRGNENAGIKMNGKQFIKDTIEVREFIFQNDYYFMMGDNRHDSRDSRYFGPVPENKIICKAAMILFSRDKEKQVEPRVFKRL